MDFKSRRLKTCLLVAGCLATGYLAGHAGAAQQHMQEARKHLEAARGELNRASADKGGHRAKALDLVGQAIDEVRRGMEAGRR